MIHHAFSAPESNYSLVSRLEIHTPQYTSTFGYATVASDAQRHNLQISTGRNNDIRSAPDSTPIFGMNFFWRVVRTIPASSSTPARYASTNAAYKITGRQARPRALTVLQPQAQQQQPPPQQSQPPPDASSASPASASVFGETLNVLDAIAADQEKLKAVGKFCFIFFLNARTRGFTRCASQK